MSRRQGSPSAWSNLLGNVSSQLFSGLATLLLAIRLPTAEFGAFMALYGVTIAAAALSDFGSTQYQVRELARKRDLSTYMSWLRARVVWASCATAVMGVVVSATGGFGLSLSVSLLLGAQLLTYTIAVALMGAVSAIRGSASAMWALALGNAFFLGLCTVSAGSDGLTLAAAGATGSWLVTSCACWMLLRPVVFRVPTARLAGSWQGSGAFGLAALSSVTLYLDLPLVAAIAGLEEAAHLGAISRWTMPIALLANASAAHLFPLMSRAPTNLDARRMRAEVRPMLGLGLIAAALLFLMAGTVVGILLGPDYQAAVPTLRLLTLAAVIGIEVPILAAYLQARDLQVSTAKVLLVGSVLRLAVAAALATRLGADAAAIAALLSALWAALALRHLAKGSESSTRIGPPSFPGDGRP